MKISKTITRREPKDNPYSYHNLRRDGIAWSQDFSGNHWSDYNAHDPGVTILEQLCYGLSDAIYRTEFDVADYLVDKDNKLDLDFLALAPPENILPCRPCTLKDYHHAIIDAVDEIERLWINIDQDSTAYNGLYRIEIQLTQLTQERCGVRANLKQMIIDKVVRIYASMRNVGEDITAVIVTKQDDYQLSADIEITMNVDINEVLADIYFVTGQWFKGLLANEESMHSYEELLASGQTIAKIFDGPTTVYSKFHQGAVSHTRSVAELHAAIQALSSVIDIKHLNLLSLLEPHKLIESVSSRASFVMPLQQSDIGVTLRQGDHYIACRFPDFSNRYQHKLFKTATIRHTRQETASLYQRPTGKFRHFERYYSIQNDFPVVYHLNVQGISPTVNAQDWVKVQQLRGYLTIFEQFLANFNANITGIRSLFSKDMTSTKTYHFNYITNKTIKGIEPLYVDNASQQLETLLSKFDFYEERKSRVFDYLLALYGETLSLTMISQFYVGDAQSLAKKLIEQKSAYLSSIIGLTKDRGGAFDYTRQLSNTNTGGFYNRLAFHLGLYTQQYSRCSEALSQFFLTIANDEQSQSLFVHINQQETDILLDAHTVIPNQAGNHSLYKKLVASLKPFKNSTINHSLLTHGTHIERYKLLPVLQESQQDNEATQYDILFNGDYCASQHTSSSWLLIGRTSSENNAHQFVNLFIEFIAHLNQASEGIHILEHILLRPSSQLSTSDVEDDLSCQISVVMPNYTQRLSNSHYQQQAEHEIEMQCPAHIMANVYWFDYQTMMRFEILYFEWLTQRKSCVIRCQASIEAGNKLMTFMREQALLKSNEIASKSNSIDQDNNLVSEQY